MSFQKILSILVAISLTAAIVCCSVTIIFLLTNHTGIEYNIPMGYILIIILLTAIALLLQIEWKRNMIEKDDLKICTECNGTGHIETQS